MPGTTLEYTLKENQTYTWITGKTVEETAKYHHYVRKGFWGLVKTADTTELTGWSSDSNLLEPKQRKELGRLAVTE